MARQLRLEYEGAFYHVTARGNERRKIYFSEYDYQKFREYLGTAQDKYGYKLHCYVLMTNHYHILIETPNGNISKVMHYINGAYTNYVNRKRNRSGHLFQGRYKAILVDQDSYLLELSRYIHMNPVRANIVNKPEEYRNSSYRSFINRKKEDIVFRELILSMISKGKKDGLKHYKSFVEKSLAEDVENPLSKVYGGVILGGTQFIKNALSQLKDELIFRDGISGKKDIAGEWKAEDILNTLTLYFNLDSKEQLIGKKSCRDIGIYLMKKHTGLTNRKIGELIGGISYAAISKAYHRFDIKLKGDKSLVKVVKKLEDRMSHV